MSGWNAVRWQISALQVCLEVPRPSELRSSEVQRWHAVRSWRTSEFLVLCIAWRSHCVRIWTMTCLQFVFISLPAPQHCVSVCLYVVSGLCESDLPTAGDVWSSWDMWRNCDISDHVTSGSFVLVMHFSFHVVFPSSGTCHHDISRAQDVQGADRCESKQSRTTGRAWSPSYCG